MTVEKMSVNNNSLCALICNHMKQNQKNQTSKNNSWAQRLCGPGGRSKQKHKEIPLAETNPAVLHCKRRRNCKCIITAEKIATHLRRRIVVDTCVNEMLTPATKHRQRMVHSTPTLSQCNSSGQGIAPDPSKRPFLCPCMRTVELTS